MAEQVKLIEYTEEQLKLIRSNHEDLTDQEFEEFMYHVYRTGLDPLSRQIYAVKRWNSRLKREVMAVQTSIDGFRIIGDRSGSYAPGLEPTYAYREDGSLLSATAHGWKMVAGRWFEISTTAFYDEYVQKTKGGQPTAFWRDKPHIMLPKCAESLLIRKAAPNDLSGIYTAEEMAQADNPEVIEDKPKELPFGSDFERIKAHDEQLRVGLEEKTGTTVEARVLEDPAAAERSAQLREYAEEKELLYDEVEAIMDRWARSENTAEKFATAKAYVDKLAEEG